MGVYLCEEAARCGYDVFVTSRRPHANRPGITYLCGDGRDVSFVRDVIEKTHPDAIVDFMLYGTNEFAARQDLLLAKTGQYVFLSSYRVYAESDVLTEGSPRLLDVSKDGEFLKTDSYALCKARCEDLLRKGIYRNWTIVRPSITYSRGRCQFGCLEASTVCYRALNGLPVVIPDEMLDKRTTMTWAGDVAKMLTRLLFNSAAQGEDFNVVTSESRTWQDVSDIYGKCLGMKRTSVSIPAYERLTNRYQLVYDRMFDRAMDNRKVLQATGMRQQELIPLAVGLGQELAAIREGSIRIEPDLERNGLMDRMCGTRMSLDDVPWSKRLDYYRMRYPAVDFGCRCIRKMMRFA